MTLILLSFVAGALTMLAPCILPVAAGGDRLEQSLLDRFSLSKLERVDFVASPAAQTAAPAAIATAALELPVEGVLPGFAGATAWLNSPPLTAEGLRGKVVLLDVWTYGCVNCRNALPYVKQWAAKYKDQGLVVVGIHSPEFAYEHRLESVERATKDLGVVFPVAVDNDFAIWRSLSNRYWPALYFVDAQGRIRHHHFGEGDYARSEQVIRQLLDEAGHPPPAAAAARPIAMSGAVKPLFTVRPEALRPPSERDVFLRKLGPIAHSPTPAEVSRSYGQASAIFAVTTERGMT